MEQPYDLAFAGFLQVCLHEMHLADTFTPEGSVRFHARFERLVTQVAQLPVAVHPAAPALLADLWALVLPAARSGLLAPALKEEVQKVLYTALRRSTVPTRVEAPTPTAFSFTPPAEYAPLPTGADLAAWT